MDSNMKVVKRNGTMETVSFDKVINRLNRLCNIEPIIEDVDVIEIAQKVCSRIYNKVTTPELDELAAQICASKMTKHYHFGILASRILISNNHKNTSPSFSECIYSLYHNTINGEKNSIISKEIYDIVLENKEKLNAVIKYDRDYLLDYFGFKTLEKSYLFKANNKIIERPQHMIMRVSLGIHGNDIKNAIRTYEYMSQQYFVHATPTLFHSGTSNPQLLSCFLLGMEDSVDGIYKTIGDCAKISKWAGGIGLWLHDIRSKNSLIRSTNGKSNGLMPLLKVLNDTAKHINQSGRRNGSFAIYLEPWHGDILEVIEAKKNHGDEEARARELFYALWINDLFMERIINNEDWYLLCPDKCKDLTNVYGDKFKSLYIKYSNDKSLVIQTINARKLWEKILVSQIETGGPYILFKDASNQKSNQKNLGTIKSSNLCTEIIEYSSSSEYACCTLASIGLPKFVKSYDFSTIENVTIYSKPNCKFCDYSKSYLKTNNIPFLEKGFTRQYIQELEDIVPEYTSYPQIFIKLKNQEQKYIGGFDELITYFKPTFDFQQLYDVTELITLNLNKIIDNNFYPVPETRYSNKLHRPIGIGVQGLADVYCLFNYAFDSVEAELLNKQIFATIYYASLRSSMHIATNRKKDMMAIQEFRKKNGPQEYCKANEYTIQNNNTIWKRGDTNSITFTDNSIQELYNRILPIDEELYGLDDRYLGAYSSFEGSPLSNGQFQFDLWNTEPITEVPNLKLDWEQLREDILNNGVRNSLCLAPMPTASTSQILGNNECIEPITSHIFSRNTLAGNFKIINKYLLKLLIDIGIWSEELKDKIIVHKGSIANIEEIPESIRKNFKISWDLSQKSLINQAADRGIYVCQSQSLNLWIANPDINKLSSMHMYSWKKGLKTGIYYLRTRAVSSAQQFTINPEAQCTSCTA